MIRKTFMTRMPDQVGAFLQAGIVIHELDLNITRVSYNKAVDQNTLFLEVEGEEAAVQEAEKRLTGMGYMVNPTEVGDVVLLEFLLPDVSGTSLPVLQLIGEYGFNISYLSSQAEDSGQQNFRIGLLIGPDGSFAQFLQQAQELAPVRVLDYRQDDQNFDNTVFYAKFANTIAKELDLSQAETMSLMVDANRLLENLRERPKAQFKTFSYLRNFATQLQLYQGKAFCPRITCRKLANGVIFTLIEPPVGSNVALLEADDELIVVDGGMYCYQKEMLAQILAMYPDFWERKRTLLLTHSDVDHCGLNDCFDTIYVSGGAYEDFANERAGKPCFRENHPMHAPYARISKILSRYRNTDGNRLCIIGERPESCRDSFSYLGEVTLAGLRFTAYEGIGGHIKGETVWICETLSLLFPGDLFVNGKDWIPKQQAFNKLAPYLMLSVDSNGVLAKQERRELSGLLHPGHWLLSGGHGNVTEIEVK